MNKPIEHWGLEALNNLKRLISTPSFSKEEGPACRVLEEYFEGYNIPTFRKGNNVWVKNLHFNPDRSNFLLNSHMDTVRPNKGYTKDPFHPEIDSGKLFGLGSNDAGGALVSLMACFMHYYDSEILPFNIIFAATAEEEISGKNGIESILDQLEPISMAIVGEPTLMKMAVAERGLLVIDCVRKGKSGHAAREEGVNALLRALEDLNWFTKYKFPDRDNFLGPVKMTPTIIQAGQEHNVVPAECTFTVDIRVPDQFTHEEILETIRTNIQSTVTPRSTRLKSSFVPLDHPLVLAGASLGMTSYGSPTTSDKALIPAPTLKLGPGDSARSHSADEFIYTQEINRGIELYIDLMATLIKHYETLGKRN